LPPSHKCERPATAGLSGVPLLRRSTSLFSRR
jgi:hypothetical protein